MKKYKVLQVITALAAIVGSMFLDSEDFCYFTAAWCFTFANCVATIIFGLISSEGDKNRPS